MANAYNRGPGEINHVALDKSFLLRLPPGLVVLTEKQVAFSGRRSCVLVVVYYPRCISRAGRATLVGRVEAGRSAGYRFIQRSRISWVSCSGTLATSFNHPEPRLILQDGALTVARQECDRSVKPPPDETRPGPVFALCPPAQSIERL